MPEAHLNQRIVALNDVNMRCRNPGSILYIFSRDQRTEDNHALLAARRRASELKLPLVTGFVAYNGSGVRAREHFAFMYTGLIELQQKLQEKNIPFVVRGGETSSTEILRLAADCKAAEIYFDFSPLRGPQQMQKAVASRADIPVYVVDTHNIVPVWVASNKQEFAARTLRPKLHRLVGDFLQTPEKLEKNDHGFKGQLAGEDLQDYGTWVSKKAKSNGIDIQFASGEMAAHRVLADFIKHRLSGYSQQRNDPSLDHLSRLSPYLHFGQLASLRVVLEVEVAANANSSLRADADALIEEVFVRKELSDNFCFYNQNYDNYNGAPDWAKRTLEKHRHDERENIYSLEELDRAQTHDHAWNAAQKQLTATGKMHGYMRMYWAKKVLEWTVSPEQAIEFLLYLNDFYHIDGGDPNGYVGIMWSVAGVHDRPWGERAIFGQIRYMNYQGLKRKFDIESYERQWQ